VAGLGNARLDVSGCWQTSRVRDPVTGLDRRLSGERPWQSRVAFRQDLVKARWAWGVTSISSGIGKISGSTKLMSSPGRQTLIYSLKPPGSAASRSISALKNVLDTARRRDRRVFTTTRFLSPLAFREFRDRTAREMILTFSGTF